MGIAADPGCWIGEDPAFRRGQGTKISVIPTWRNWPTMTSKFSTNFILYSDSQFGYPSSGLSTSIEPLSSSIDIS
jgi:hypothetical protein